MKRILKSIGTLLLALTLVISTSMVSFAAEESNQNSTETVLNEERNDDNSGIVVLSSTLPFQISGYCANNLITFSNAFSVTSPNQNVTFIITAASGTATVEVSNQWGGWWEWTSGTSQTYNLPLGTYTVRIRAPRNGFAYSVNIHEKY